MKPENMVMGIVFILQTTVGILVNSSVLLHYLVPGFTGKGLKLKTLIVKHLTLANSLSIISRGIPQIMAEFGMKYFLDDIGCKLVLYLYRVSRGVSLYTTCLLSCFQATIISSSTTKWMKFKHKAIKYMGPSCSLSWPTNLLLNVMILVTVTSSSNRRNATKKLTYGYCSASVSGTIATPLYMLLLSFTDVLCLSLMSWASVFMLSILHRHKKQVQYIHGAQHSLRVSPEARATQTILILACTFVTFYSISSIMVLYSALFGDPGLWVINIISVLETCYPIFCSFVLISNNSSASRLYLHCWWKR
uniref:Vomeronasal type-1 receptor n=1 Tax=Mus musculus musculus TaxID=39442 RepID=F6MCF7_MOUSE|nr:vomeronasal type 1 receptor G12 [Mus musculus musculus]AEF00613.1 vomeronasal type 1 receptor G12 [Mus musculus musculus]AEF00614.1 vomeronasal type 1 receptor G12 [Mus musculus musculus]AEF00615.1 vomeronasal type 1 receptor G12 [Mus musculus musculus]AEF00616.1 vomeronasal type 1 receptor G12 [Mus musculus musculus]